MDNTKPQPGHYKTIIGIDPALNVGVAIHRMILDGTPANRAINVMLPIGQRAGESFQDYVERQEERQQQIERFDPRYGG